MYSSSLSPSSTPEPLPNLNNYKILKILGEGGFGKVLKCVRQETEDTVAIKIGKKYSDLRREVRHLILISQLQNTHVFKRVCVCYILMAVVIIT